MCRFYVISAALLVLLNGELTSQTNITSDITTNTIWNISGSPYIIQNSITVQNGVTLTVDAGVLVKFDLSTSLFIEGTIVAQGQKSNQIIFASNQPVPNIDDWGAIRIQPASGATSLIEYCTFSYSRFSVKVINASPTIQNCDMSQTRFSAVQIDGGSAIVQYNDIYSNEGASVFVGTGTPEISYNVLHDNKSDGIHVLTLGSPVIHHNIIYGNPRYGINSSTGCIIFNNTIDENWTAINCDNESPTLFNNIISNHTLIGIRAVNGAAPVLSYNDFWNNGTNYFGTSPGTGDISLDPKFVDQANRDYHLQSNSPCIDAGDPNSLLDPDQTRNDMGALFFNQITTITIAIDIKPQSCPNPLNTKSKGVLPVAILGSDELDVSSINPQSVSLSGVSPIRWGIEDVSTPIMERQNECDCTTDGADGFDDLTLKFKTQEIVAAIGSVNNGTEVVLTITAELFDGTLLEGEDCIIVKSKSTKNSKTISPNFESLSVLQNYPNPFNPSTQIEYSIPKSSLVVLKIYNINGQEIRTLVDEFQSPNTYLVSWDGRNDNSESVPSGVYFANILAESFSKTVRLVLVK